MPRLILQCLLGIGVWFCCANVPAQDVSGPGLPEKKSDTVIRRSPLIVLIDSDGNWLYSLPGGWPRTVVGDFYDFLFNRDQKAPPPPFIIRNVIASGTVVNNYVKANVQIEIATSGSQTIQVPLGFKEGILISEDQPDIPAFNYMGSGSASLSVNPEGYYVANITPQVPEPSESEKPEKPEHTISLLLWIPLALNGGNETKLSISFPQSNSSRFFLEVPMSNIDTSVTRGHVFDTQENAERQSTVLRIHGLRSNTEIAWRKRVVKIIDDRPELVVERATIDVKLDADAQTVAYDAVLPVSSATGSFEQMLIRLPQGGVLDREWADRYAVAGNYVVGDVSADSVVTVRFPQKTSGPVSIYLRAVQQFEENMPDFRRELSGFEVLGAERQTGSLAVSVLPLEKRPHWDPMPGIRRTEGAGSSVGSSGETRFDFVLQPFLLRVRVAAPQKRVNVKPRYHFSINRGEITMTARLFYTVSGSKTDVLYLHLPDSQWDWDFSTAGIVDTSGVEWDESGDLKIPLISAQERTFNIEFRARRTIDFEDERQYRLVLPIPKPQQVAWSESADVTIASTHNIEVLPIDQEIRGLTRLTRREALSRRIDTTDLQQESLYFSTELPDATFVADLIFHQPKINATMRTDVRLSEEFPRVEQTIYYNAAFTWIERVYVFIPRTLDSSGDIQVRSNNRPLELRSTIPDSLVSVPDNYVRKVVQLSEPVSRLDLTFLYSLPPLAVSEDNTVPFPFFFIYPADISVADHRIHFFTPPNFKVELQNESKQLWEPFREPRRPSLSATETFRSAHSPTKIASFISAPKRNISGTTIVERAWLQTWLTGAMRVDRASYRVRSTNESVSLQLPPDSTRNHPVGVQVDGQPIPPNISPTGMLTIPISPEQYNRSIDIFVDYRYSFGMPEMRVPITLPSFADETLVQHEFWQLILLQNQQHIIDGPKGWTLKYDWSWNGLFWWRTPSIRKSDIGFEPDSPDIEATISESSQYVFSHLQPTPNVRLYIVNRSSIILLASSIALLIGLVLIYVPQSRYAGSLFGLGVGLLAVLLYQPALVLLMLQASVFGVFLALGAGYLYRIFHRQREWIPPVFSMAEDVSQPPPTPHPPSQVVHEVIIDGESGSKEPSEVKKYEN